jgi:acetamidase/formamidase
MGVAVPRRLHSTPPGPHGGNVDVPLLGAGSTLHLPVQVPGALAYVGDPHFAQGCGEVALTAFEAPLRATLRLDLTPADRFGGPLSGPLGETDRLWIPIGLDADLDEALRSAVRQALDLLVARYDMDRPQAYAYLSAAGDFAVSQVVDGVKGVHGVLRKGDFAEVRR